MFPASREGRGGRLPREEGGGTDAVAETTATSQAEIFFFFCHTWSPQCSPDGAGQRCCPCRVDDKCAVLTQREQTSPDLG